MLGVVSSDAAGRAAPELRTGAAGAPNPPEGAGGPGPPHTGRITIPPWWVRLPGGPARPGVCDPPCRARS